MSKVLTREVLSMAIMTTSGLIYDERQWAMPLFIVPSLCQKTLFTLTNSIRRRDRHFINKEST